MGRELGSVVDDIFMRMVENMDVWNAFPCVEHIWRELYNAIRNVSSNMRGEFYTKVLHVALMLDFKIQQMVIVLLNSYV